MRIYDNYVKEGAKTIVKTDDIQKYFKMERCYGCSRSIHNSQYVYVDDSIKKRFRYCRYYHISCSYKKYRLISVDEAYNYCRNCKNIINSGKGVVEFLRNRRQYYHENCYEK